MRAVAASLSDQDMADLAAFYSSRADAVGFALAKEDTTHEKARYSPLSSLRFAGGAAQAGNPEAGKEKSRTCAACHGADGNSADARFPEARRAALRLPRANAAGTTSRASARTPIMAPQAANLSQRDIEDLAAYYSHQQGLVTRKNSLPGPEVETLKTSPLLRRSALRSAKARRTSRGLRRRHPIM